MKVIFIVILFSAIEFAYGVPPGNPDLVAAAAEGDACGGRGGPVCEAGLTCVGKIQQVDGQGKCRRDAANCPSGILPVNCFVNPCDVETCGGQGSAADQVTCLPSYCGGCTAVFYDNIGSIANCTDDLQQEGDDCGPCFSPPKFDCGTCAPGLKCSPVDPDLPDRPGYCIQDLENQPPPGLKEDGEECSICFECPPGREFGSSNCAAGLECEELDDINDSNCPGYQSGDHSCGRCEIDEDANPCKGVSCGQTCVVEGDKEGVCNSAEICSLEDDWYLDCVTTNKTDSDIDFDDAYSKIIFCQNQNDANHCEERSDGEFNACHSLTQPSCIIDNVLESPCYGICIPDEQTCVDDTTCKSIGTLQSGLISSSCQQGKCVYDGAIMIA